MRELREVPCILMPRAKAAKTKIKSHCLHLSTCVLCVRVCVVVCVCVWCALCGLGDLLSAYLC